MNRNKKSTEDKKNYKTMDLERDKKEALTGNLALKYRIRLTTILSLLWQLLGTCILHICIYISTRKLCQTVGKKREWRIHRSAFTTPLHSEGFNKDPRGEVED